MKRKRSESDNVHKGKKYPPVNKKILPLAQGKNTPRNRKNVGGHKKLCQGNKKLFKIMKYHMVFLIVK